MSGRKESLESKLAGIRLGEELIKKDSAASREHQRSGADGCVGGSGNVDGDKGKKGSMRGRGTAPCKGEKKLARNNVKKGKANDGPEDDRSSPALRGKASGKKGEKLREKKEDKLRQQKENEKMSAVDITIPQWQIEEIRKQLKLPDGHGNVDFFRHFISNKGIDTPFKNEYLRVINKDLEQTLKEESLKNDAPTQIENKRSADDKPYAKSPPKRGLTKMKSFRRKLPVFGSRQEILSMIDKHQVILLTGETGSGKTTQIPQFILDQAIMQGKGSSCCIICTQPRRISAITVSERVAAERGEELGHSVGYRIRLESRSPRSDGGSITFCTTGIVLSIMQNDLCLKDCSHLILDEIHERDSITDLVLGIIKMILPHRKHLKVILMSATLTAETFSSYFDDCPTVHIPGFTFPVEEFYLEDIVADLNFHNFVVLTEKTRRVLNRPNKEFNDMINPYLSEIQSRYPAHVLKTISNPLSETNQNGLIVELIYNITNTKPKGAILVFLPSLIQITEVHMLLSKHLQLSRLSTSIYPLHSKVPKLDQKAVFSRPRSGTRKIILATDIAETSITIDDVVYVINTGRHKINMYNDGISSLEDEWISISNEIQRKGRAGRTQPGICYHLYTRARRNVLLQNTPPEILRIALDEVILKIKILALGDARRFLERLLDQPLESVIAESLQLLNRLNAIDDNERLTPLGYHLARLKMDTRTGKMVLLSSIFSCTDPITSIAASLSFKDAFYRPFGKEEQVDEVRCKFAEDSHSDHLMLANVIHQWGKLSYRKRPDFAKLNFLDRTTLNQLCIMKQQFCEYLHEAKLLSDAKPDSQRNNHNSGNEKLLTAIIGAGLYPNVAVVQHIVRNRKQANGQRAFFPILTIEGQGLARIHPSSVNRQLDTFDSNFVVYFNKLKLKVLTIFDTTLVNPFALFFFGDNHVETNEEFELISIAGRYCLKCNKETYQFIQDLRAGFNLFLQKKICEPSPVNWLSEEGILLRAIIHLITIDGKYEDEFDYDDPLLAVDGNLEEIPLD